MKGAQFLRLPSAMRLALSLSALFVALAIIAGAVAWFVMGDELRTRLYDDARLQAQALAAELAANAPDEWERQIGTVSAFGQDHGTLYHYQPVGGGRTVGNMAMATPFEGPRRLVAGRDMTVLPDPGSQEGEVYFAWGVRASAGWIVVARDSQWITDSQEVLVQSIAWGLGVALVATVFLAFAIGRRDTRRVTGIRRVLADVAGGNLSARYTEHGRASDDLSEVAEGINRMLERLEANVERLAQFSADIAHDLRSPLTRLRLRLEPQALRDDLPRDTRSAIARSLESLDAISASFDAILQLSQIETGNLALVTSPVDLRDIAGDVHEMLQPVAEEAGHVIDLSLPQQPVPAEVNAELISQALVNLVDNALRHTPAGTRIRIEVGQGEDGLRMTVCDDGPGIPAGERDKVSRRFYRLDRSRNSPGTGLGLSLVAAIAHLHGGGLELSDNGPGLCAAMRLWNPDRSAASN